MAECVDRTTQLQINHVHDFSSLLPAWGPWPYLLDPLPTRCSQWTLNRERRGARRKRDGGLSYFNNAMWNICEFLYLPVSQEPSLEGLWGSQDLGTTSLHYKILLKFIIICVCTYVYVWSPGTCMPQHVCRGQRITFGSLLLPYMGLRPTQATTLI